MSRRIVLIVLAVSLGAALLVCPGPASAAPQSVRPAGRPARHPRSLLQHLVHGRPADRRLAQALDGQAQRHDRPWSASTASRTASWAPSRRRIPALAQTVARGHADPDDLRLSRTPGSRLTLTFLSPLLIDDLDILSRPVTYVTFDVRSPDGRPHAVALYFDASRRDRGEHGRPEGRLVAAAAVDGLDVLCASARRTSPSSSSKGDDLRIDWGYLLSGRPAASRRRARSIASDRECRGRPSSATGRLPARDDLRMPRPVSDGYPVAAAGLRPRPGRRRRRSRAG